MNLWNLLNKKVTGATHKKAINVPITPNKKIYIKYLKNDLLFKLYPAPKIINGRIYVKKILSENASEFVKSGAGYIVAAVGQESGEIPFTCFSANKDYIKNNPQVIIAFTKAIKRGMEYIKTANINDVVNSLKPSFVGTSDESIKVAVQHYASVDAWNDDLVMTNTNFDRLITMLKTAGELAQTATVNCAKVVNNNFGQFVLNEYFG